MTKPVNELTQSQKLHCIRAICKQIDKIEGLFDECWKLIFLRRYDLLVSKLHILTVEVMELSEYKRLTRLEIPQLERIIESTKELWICLIAYETNDPKKDGGAVSSLFWCIDTDEVIYGTKEAQERFRLNNGNIQRLRATGFCRRLNKEIVKI